MKAFRAFFVLALMILGMSAYAGKVEKSPVVPIPNWANLSFRGVDYSLPENGETSVTLWVQLDGKTKNGALVDIELDITDANAQKVKPTVKLTKRLGVGFNRIDAKLAVPVSGELHAYRLVAGLDTTNQLRESDEYDNSLFVTFVVPPQSAPPTPSPSATPTATPPPTVPPTPSPTPTISCKQTESDGDGFSDALETALGTDPDDPTSYPPFGDFNNDGQTNIVDGLSLYRAAKNGQLPYNFLFDVNRDGVVDTTDGTVIYKWSIDVIHVLPFCVDATPTPTPEVTSLEIAYPIGGETFTAGQPIQITWVATGSITSVALYYQECPSCEGNVEIGEFSAGKGACTWTPELYDSQSVQMKIWAIGKNAGGQTVKVTSTDFFTVVASTPTPTPTLTPTPTPRPTYQLASTSAGINMEPKISTMAVIWAEIAADSPSVTKNRLVAYLRDTDQTVYLTDWLSAVAFWEIDGSSCVWVESDIGQSSRRIKHHDFVTGETRQVYSSNLWAGPIDLEGSRMVWCQTASRGATDLVLMDLNTNQLQVIKQGIIPNAVSLHWPWVVYVNENVVFRTSDVCAKNLETGQDVQVTNDNNGFKWYPGCNGQYFVWQNVKDNTLGLYNIDTGSTTTITADHAGGSLFGPRFYGNNLGYFSERGIITVRDLFTGQQTDYDGSITGQLGARLYRFDICADGIAAEVVYGSQTDTSIGLINLNRGFAP